MAEGQADSVGTAADQIEAVLLERERPSLPGEDPRVGAAESASEEASEPEGEHLEGEAGEPEADADSESTTERSPVFAIDVDGQEQEVTLDELRNGYQRQADYTRKTQALAAERREIEQQRAQVVGAQQAQLARLDELQSRVLQSLGEEKEPDWQKLREEDPTEYAVQREARREKIELAQRIAHERQAQLESWKAQQRPTEIRALSEKIPEWSDPERFRKDYTDLGRWLIDGGWTTAEEWNEVVDHRVVALAEYARRYLDSTRARPTAEAKVKNLPRVSKPGRTRLPERERRNREQQAMKRLRRSGTIDDAANAILAGIEQ